MSGWQCEEKYLLDQCSIILNRIINRFPDGTLWVLNRESRVRLELVWRMLTSIAASSPPRDYSSSSQSPSTGAKLHRMRHETPAAITIIEDALAKGSSFREADSLLVFEVRIDSCLSDPTSLLTLSMCSTRSYHTAVVDVPLER